MNAKLLSTFVHKNVEMPQTFLYSKKIEIILNLIASIQMKISLALFHISFSQN